MENRLKMRCIFILICLFITISCSAQNKEVNVVDNLKKAAFCQCLYKGFENENIDIGNEGSASAYIQKGEASIDNYLKVFEASNIFIKNESENYTSKNGNSLVVMKCLDFFYSKELDELIKSLK